MPTTGVFTIGSPGHLEQTFSKSSRTTTTLLGKKMDTMFIERVLHLPVWAFWGLFPVLWLTTLTLCVVREIIILNSSAHGAGRLMSRAAAKKTLDLAEQQRIIDDAGVLLLGAGADEYPGAYKDPEQVLAAQDGVVDIIGRFKPRIVKMAGKVKHEPEAVA